MVSPTARDMPNTTAAATPDNAAGRTTRTVVCIRLAPMAIEPWRIDWGTAPNVLMGGGVMAMALYDLNWTFDAGRVLAFLVLFTCGVLIAYSFMLLLTSTSVWLVRNQSLMEMWWMFSSLARYPREIFAQAWAEPIGRFFTYILPILLVVNVPARVMVKTLDPPM